MQISAAGRLSGVTFKAAYRSGGAMTPELIVVHDTAGRLEKGNAVNWFRNPQCKVSAHVVIEIDGTITQLVPFTRKAWHAGKSAWNGRVGCNSFSIGIELVNPGKLDAKGKAWFGACGADGIEACSTPEHGAGHWMPYPPAQIAALTKVCQAIVEEYPACNEIVGHWQISPGRKIDPTPLFPWDSVRAAVLEHKDDDDEDEDDRPPADPVKPPVSTATKVGVGAGGVAGTSAVIAQTKEGVEVLQQVKKVAPGWDSLAWPAAIIGAAIIAAVLLLRKRS